MRVPEDVGIQKQLTDIHIQKWLDGELFQIKWWIFIGLFAAVIITWWVLVKKDRLLEICLYAIVSGAVFLGIDQYGQELTLWDYPIDIIPLFPPLSSLNMLILPLTFSLLYQYFPSRKFFFVAAAIASAAMCFVIEPILALAGFYRLIHWRYYESLPVYLLLAMLIRFFIMRINNIMEQHKLKKNVLDEV